MPFQRTIPSRKHETKIKCTLARQIDQERKTIEIIATQGSTWRGKRQDVVAAQSAPHCISESIPGSPPWPRGCFKLSPKRVDRFLRDGLGTMDKGRRGPWTGASFGSSAMASARSLERNLATRWEKGCCAGVGGGIDGSGSVGPCCVSPSS